MLLSADGNTVLKHATTTNSQDSQNKSTDLSGSTGKRWYFRYGFVSDVSKLVSDVFKQPAAVQ